MLSRKINVANRGSIASCFCSSCLVYHVHYGSRMYLLSVKPLSWIWQWGWNYSSFLNLGAHWGLLTWINRHVSLLYGHQFYFYEVDINSYTPFRLYIGLGVSRLRTLAGRNMARGEWGNYFVFVSRLWRCHLKAWLTFLSLDTYNAVSRPFFIDFPNSIDFTHNCFCLACANTEFQTSVRLHHIKTPDFWRKYGTTPIFVF